MSDFKRFVNIVEFAEFGFGSKLMKRPMGGTKTIAGHKVIDIIHSSKIIGEIVNSGSIGNHKPNQRFQNLIEYGSEPGAIQLHLTPLGSYKIITRRLASAINGEQVWICKKVFPLEEGLHNTIEEVYASEIHDYMTGLNEENLDAPSVEFKDFNKLSLRLFANVRKTFPSYCMFPIGLFKKSENYHKCVFEFRGHGVEAPTASRAEQFNIDLLYDKKLGLIRCWGYNIDSSTKQHSWRVQPSEWDEWFAPTQKFDEIVDAISKIFMTY